jgi:IPT/TIG domain
MEKKKNAHILMVCIVMFITVESCKKDTAVAPILIKSFNPTIGETGDRVRIMGSGFGNSISSSKIFFNGVEAVITFLDDTLISAIVPPNATSGKISVTLDGRNVTSTNDFVLLPGNWLRKKDLPFSPRWYAYGFSIGNKGYVGAGQALFTNVAGSNLTDWWEYDPFEDQWISRTAIPFSGGLEWGVSFAIGDKGYLGIGMTDSVLTNEFWQYDTTANKWTRKADFPGNWKVGAIGLSIGNKGYVGLGLNYDDSVGGNWTPGVDWWEYDPVIDQWTQKSDIPVFGEVFPSGLVINKKIYLGMGEVTFGYYQSWWEYDPASDQWTQKSDYPVSQILQEYAVGFTIGNKGYINGIKECWAYDPALDLWTKQSFFTDFRDDGVSFSMAGKGYYATGYGDDILENDLWEFTPSQ